MQIKDYQIVLLGIFIALGSIFSTYILSKSIVEFQKLQNQTIKVTGSASQKVTSDSASWEITFRTTKPTLKEGYSQLEADAKKVKSFFTSNGIEENAITFSTVMSDPKYKRFPGSYNYSNEIESYEVYQYVTVKSKDINKLTDITKKVNTLINQDVNLTANSVQYFVSNLDNIKVEVAQEAAKNAKERAQSLVKGTNGRIGVMTGAKLGVFQIIPIDSTEVNDYGINDTTSIEKKVVSTVTATFTVK